jgi:hypothetical protein
MLKNTKKKRRKQILFQPRTQGLFGRSARLKLSFPASSAVKSNMATDKGRRIENIRDKLEVCTLF